MNEQRYIIHSCDQRLWWVNHYMIPLLHEQDIYNIEIWNDDDHLGCLENCMRIFSSMDGDGGSWHLQDDVVACRDFKKLTEQYNYGIVCGFVSNKDQAQKSGHVLPPDMWYSFPCIRIPNRIARECAEWYYSFAKSYAKYYEWVEMGKCDDNFFAEFMKNNYPYMTVLNLKPNLVDHVDYLIGGSVVNQYRLGAQVRAVYFEDLDLIDKLKKELVNSNE